MLFCVLASGEVDPEWGSSIDAGATLTYILSILTYEISTQVNKLFTLLAGTAKQCSMKEHQDLNNRVIYLPIDQ